MDLQQIGWVMLAGVLLGSNIVMVRLGTQHIPSMFFTLLRFVITLIAFAITIAVTSTPIPARRRVWTDTLITGIANTGIPVICFTFSVKYISSGVLAVMIALYPLFTAILAHRFLDYEKLTVRSIAGLGLALAGSLLIIFTGTTGLEQAGDIRGHLLALVGVVSSAIGAVYMREHLTDQDGTIITAGQVVFSLPLVIPFVLFGAAVPLDQIRGLEWFAVFYTALAGSFAGYLLLFYLIKRYGATIGALPGYLMPITATLLGALVLGEIITLPLIIGAVMVLTGVVLVSA